MRRNRGYAQANELPFASLSITSVGSTDDGRAQIGDSTHMDGLKCLSYKARSIANKIPDLKALLATERPHVVAITETFLSAEILDAELTCDTPYTVFRREKSTWWGCDVACQE